MQPKLIIKWKNKFKKIYVYLFLTASAFPVLARKICLTPRLFIISPVFFAGFYDFIFLLPFFLQFDKILNFFLIEVRLIYNVLLVSPVQQNDSVLYIYFFFFRFFSIIDYYKKNFKLLFILCAWSRHNYLWKFWMTKLTMGCSAWEDCIP